MIKHNFYNQSFLRLKKPSPCPSPTKVRDKRARAGRAIKSKRVIPVTFPAECFPGLLILFSLP